MPRKRQGSKASLIRVEVTVKKKSVSFRMKESTAKELAELKKRVNSSDKKFKLQIDDVIEQELLNQIRKAHQEIDSLNKVLV